MGPRSRSPSPRGDNAGRGGERDDDRKPMSLLVRGLPRDIRSEDIRSPFERYGSVRDVYLPRDYYTKRIPFALGWLRKKVWRKSAPRFELSNLEVLALWSFMTSATHMKPNINLIARCSWVERLPLFTHKKIENVLKK
ncbi:Arginine/serine-rich splicing factor scl25a transcript I [Cymbomonas tetramitiformis]|uniref:Arginine/serine-rich splicing factor scl25a transcript I n=1 Tax=Cymbomonas tetramitiformis TaxID=36881 RepID=A0AAE0GG89_9CHLO|nr:Arginine/serine-rich splicing factor scl25a transcript I [Cymbomonas tetramitiformis]